MADREDGSREEDHDRREAFVAEGISLVRAVRQTRAEARERSTSWRQYVRETTGPMA